MVQIVESLTFDAILQNSFDNWSCTKKQVKATNSLNDCKTSPYFGSKPHLGKVQFHVVFGFHHVQQQHPESV